MEHSRSLESSLYQEHSTADSIILPLNTSNSESFENPRCYSYCLMVTLIFNLTTILCCGLFYLLNPSYPMHTLLLAGFNVLYAMTIVKCFKALYRKSYKTQKIAMGYLLGLLCVFVPLFNFLTVDFPLAWESGCLGVGYLIVLFYFLWKGKKLQSELEHRNSVNFNFEINLLF